MAYNYHSPPRGQAGWKLLKKQTHRPFRVLHEGKSLERTWLTFSCYQSSLESVCLANTHMLQLWSYNYAKMKMIALEVSKLITICLGTNLFPCSWCLIIIYPAKREDAASPLSGVRHLARRACSNLAITSGRSEALHFTTRAFAWPTIL